MDIPHKACTKCKALKPLSDFSYRKTGAGNLHSECKKCLSIKAAKWRLANRDKVEEMYVRSKANKARYYIENKDRLLKKEKDYYNANKLKFAEKNRLRYQENKDVIGEKQREWYHQNIELERERARTRYGRNKERKKIADKLRRITHKEKLSEQRRAQHERAKKDPLYRLRNNMRGRLHNILKQKRWEKNKSTLELLGVDFLTFRAHIARQFKKGMTWENNTTDGWHIDHIIPLSSAKTKDELFALCHYTNLQPLWAFDNLSKNDKILPVQVKMTI